MRKTEPAATILVVDDTPANIDVVKGILSPYYTIQAAISGPLALKIISRKQPDLILLDIMMPEIDGYEVCRQIKAQPQLRDIPIIFITAKHEEEDEAQGLAVGGVDYITKPISAPILRERVKTHLTLREARVILQRQNEILEEKILERTRQMDELQDVAMVSMGALAEARDPETGNHIRRTQHYVKLLAENLSDHPQFQAFMTPETITMLFKSAPLHDVGKVGIADKILLKPNKLTAEEFETMKTHTTIGRDAIASAMASMTRVNNFLTFAAEIAYGHHEKWDGSGYPLGLSGEAIPISARLMALADVYDALISRRVYKEAFTHEVSVEIIAKGRGTHFDPVMVDVFMEIADQFYEIAQKYADTDEDVLSKAKRFAPDFDP